MFANYAIDTSKQYIYFHSSLLGIYKTLTPISSKLMITAKNIFWPEGRVWSLINTPTTLAAINNNDMQISKSISSYYEQSSLPSYQNESYALDQMIGSYNSIMENSSEYTISEDKYFMYVVSRDDVWYDNYCNDASYQVEPTDVVVMPKQALITVLQRRSSRLSAAQRIDWIQRIQIRLQQQKNLTPQEYALMVSALYVFNQDSIVDCSVWQKASIDRLWLSFEYPECRWNISITEWTQYNYFAMLHMMDIIDTKTLSGASLTGYFFEIKFSNLWSNAVMRIENKNPKINYGKLSIWAYLYDYAIRKSTTWWVERIEGVRFFDTCFMWSCGDNELMLNLGVQKKVDKGNGNYGYVIMRFGIINPVTSYSNISDYVAPWFASISNYAVQWMNNNPRTWMEYRDGYRWDLISNLNSKPTIDLAHTEVINMMKRFYNSIK